MPTFVHPSLLWGLPLAGVPLLIHLINVLRHRRVRWAAMEFLLASQKRNRTWVALKQLLLLLVRTAAVALLVLVVAQPVIQSPLGGLFGQSRIHHTVILDDSFSMSERWGDTSALEEAKRVVARIGAEAARRAQPQTFTLLRFSRAERPALGTQPDLLRETVDRRFAEALAERLESIEPSHLAVGAAPALRAVGQLMGREGGDRRVVYLVSDFRARQWDEPGELTDLLTRLNEAGAELHLVNCVDAHRPNLAVAELVAGPGTRAAGVPLSMEVTVKNFGTAPARDVPVSLETDGQPRPAVAIAEILPGEAATERFSMHFPTAGEHRITARLDADAVVADNARHCVIDVPQDLPVLLIDGDPRADDARYLSAALAPGGPVPTGIRTRIELPRYLSLNPLSPFRSIYLLNVDRLDASAVAALEEYVRSGGGLGVFLGERCDNRRITDQWHRDATGFFPAPLAGETELPVDRLQRAPDLEVGEHPVFRVFRGQRNSFLATVIVERYFAVPDDWQPAPDSATRVIARLRNGAPLALERSFGDGRVVAFLTSAAPTWNNWARANPSFVVAMLELQAFLGARPVEDAPCRAGEPVHVELDPIEYQGQVRFSLPGDRDDSTALVDAVLGPDGKLVASLPSADRSGIYQAELMRKDGAKQVRRLAVNVDADEGDLTPMPGPELASRLKGVGYHYHGAGAFQLAEQARAGRNLADPLLYLLVLLLVVEQVLAWSAGYHPPAGQLVAKGGAR
jgi:hypothetical protein